MSADNHATAAPVGVPGGLLSKAVKATIAQQQQEQQQAVAAAPAPVTIEGGAVYSIPMALAARLLVPAKGQGGWQSIMTTLREGVSITEDTALLTATPQTFAKLLTYSVKHGGGGYQGTFRWLVCVMVAGGQK